MFTKSKKNMMAIAVNKSLLKEYPGNERIVYLKNGDEFQIQLFNPERFTIGAKIFIDNEAMNGMIVLKPGERVWLERYLDEARKFKFSTYEVDANDRDVDEAIRDNGLIRVEFYREVKEKSTWNPNIVYHQTWPYHTWPLHTEPYTGNGIYSTGDFICGQNSRVTCDCNIDNSALQSCTTTAQYSDSVTTATTTNTATFSSDNNELFGSAIEASCDSAIRNLGQPLGKKRMKTKETGRTEKGSLSEQNFNTVYNKFEDWSYTTETVRIMPASQKPYTQKDIKTYCTECGRKLNPKYKFCPYCGAKCE